MNISRIENTTQLSAITSALLPVVEPVVVKTIAERYKIIEQIARKFGYTRKSITKKSRKEVITLCMQATGLSRSRIKHLLVAYIQNKGRLSYTPQKKNVFPTTYTTLDIARLIDTDNALRRMSGNATTHVFKRMWHVYGNKQFEHLSGISTSHLYNLRETRQYQSQVLLVKGTKSVAVPIGKREKPKTEGKPGYIRVDTVHQGDLGKVKGVYYINLVDEVTQWEVVACVPNISEASMHYVLATCLELFPFRIIGFHSDNGGEYINYTVAGLLKKLEARQTKSRARHCNDNALAEGKNGSVIRKHFGHGHIPKKHAEAINTYLIEYMAPFLNFHRPCGFATLKIDHRGKEKKVYDTYLTPYEKLNTIKNQEQYLKPGVTLAGLRRTEQEYDDVSFAKLKEEKRIQLLKKLS